MKKFAFFLLALLWFFMSAGCGRIDGPRFWWDDKTREKLPDSYRLPYDPGDTSLPGEMSDNGDYADSDDFADDDE